MDDWQTVGENDWQSVGGQAAPPIGPEIAGGVTAALQHAVANAKDYLNPFSEARHASYAQQAAAPLGQAIQQNLGQIAGTGSRIGESHLGTYAGCRRHHYSASSAWISGPQRSRRNTTAI